MFKEFKKGLIKENPVFVIMLGLCPTLGVSTEVLNALGMGVAATFVLVCSNVMISLLKKFISNSIRIPAFIVIIASFVTIVQMVMNAYVPTLYAALGVYLPLIVVNCIILGRAEAFASKHTPLESALDGLGMGCGFTLSLLLISFIREMFGKGTITLPGVKLSIPGLVSSPVRVISLSAGALLLMGYLLAFFGVLRDKKTAKANAKESA